MQNDKQPVVWRYDIQHGPEGEANYAWIYRDGEMIATMKTHYASEIVALAAAPASAPEPVDTPWQPMSTAPTDGTHCILAVRSEPFIFPVQGAYLSGEWCAAFIDGPVEPLAWMPNVRLPDWVWPATT